MFNSLKIHDFFVFCRDLASTHYEALFALLEFGNALAFSQASKDGGNRGRWQGEEK